MFKYEYKPGRFAFGEVDKHDRVQWITRRRHLPKGLPATGVTLREVEQPEFHLDA